MQVPETLKQRALQSVELALDLGQRAVSPLLHPIDTTAAVFERIEDVLADNNNAAIADLDAQAREQQAMRNVASGHVASEVAVGWRGIAKAAADEAAFKKGEQKQYRGKISKAELEELEAKALKADSLRKNSVRTAGRAVCRGLMDVDKQAIPCRTTTADMESFMRMVATVYPDAYKKTFAEVMLTLGFSEEELDILELVNAPIYLPVSVPSP